MECTAQTRPEDYVREFIAQLEHPMTALQTHTRSGTDDPVWGSTNWGEAGKAAILAALRKQQQE